MNPTRNIKCIEVEQDIFTQLCEVKYDESVGKIQNRYQVLKESVERNISRWMKIRDKDVYLETKTKVLFPDTRKMAATDLRCNISASYYPEILQYVKNCSTETLAEIKRLAEERKQIIPSEFETQIEGLDACAMTRDLIRKLFDDKSCPCMTGNRVLELGNNCFCSYILTGDAGGGCVYCTENDSSYGCTVIEAALKISIYVFNSDLSIFDIIVQYGFYPEQFDDKTVDMLKDIHEIVGNGVNVENFDELKTYLRANHIEKFMGEDLRWDAIENEIEAEEIDLLEEDGIGGKLKTYFDECDYIRSRVQKYHSRWYLSDEGKGHWELWSTAGGQTGKKEANVDELPKKRILRLKSGVIARNPAADVRHDAVVGIDFGTKSTIVALQDGDDEIIPLRVGMADYTVAPEAKHFENPTVMQFVDLSRFVKQYHKAAGRPLTSWDDLMISHEAFENLIGSGESIEIAAFVTDIKQWAAGKYGDNKNGGHLIIKDVKGYRYDIDNYMNLSEEDIDLVEIYAYYIGLFINNMHTGIYLDYLLSFPETFSIEIRNRILQSFAKGIRKSIPEAVLEDTECKGEFRVRQGCSEPAAYAVCALEQYGIEPTDEGVFYGIFDFGGGTTDYDYGIWKNAPEDEYTYNYVIKHYGSGGDKTLGGENILQLLAYNVFSDDSKQKGGESNLDIMRQHKFTYCRPYDGKIQPGTEALNNDSESALLNTKQMMEALRPIWEEWKEFYEWLHTEKMKKYHEINAAKNVMLILGNNASIKVRLLLFSDMKRENVELSVNMDMLNPIINNRIESGVRNFFEGFRMAYGKWDKKTNEKVHLFLAGNSSRSSRVERLFDEYVEKYNTLMFCNGSGHRDNADPDILNVFGVRMAFPIGSDLEEKETKGHAGDMESLDNTADNRFIVYPPLGTEEAREIQRQHGITAEENNLMAPTGKTGVAFGLVMCREGSMIRVESETGKSEQIKLNYYIGINYRKKFKMIFDRSTEYHKWLKFSKVAAETETFEFYYSGLPEVVGGDVLIKEEKSIYKRKCLLDNVKCNAYIYFRFVSPAKLEYVAALEEKIETGEYISKIYTVEL